MVWMPLVLASMLVTGLFFCQVQDECLGVEWRVCLCIFSLILLSGGVDPGVRCILHIAASRANILVSGGECFVCWGRSEHLGVEE